jgi:predicted metal-dependent hydrolase
MQITLANHLFQYQLDYSKNRQTLSLKLMDSATLLITAPQGLSLKKIRQLLESKTAWIINQSDKLRLIEQNPVNKLIADGAEILYIGKVHKLLFHHNADCHEVKVKDQIIHLHFPALNPLSPTDLLRQFFIKSACHSFQQLTGYWANIMHVKPLKIAIRKQKTRWGSCSSTGTISYNWLVIMTPDEVMQYLVIHELSHLIEPNHSRRFWQIVKTFDPNFAKHRLWLKDNGRLVKDLFAT